MTDTEVLALANSLRGKRVHTYALREFTEKVDLPDGAVVTITGPAEDAMTDHRYLDIVADVTLDEHPAHPEHPSERAWVWADILTYDRETGEMTWHVKEVR